MGQWAASTLTSGYGVGTLIYWAHPSLSCSSLLYSIKFSPEPESPSNQVGLTFGFGYARGVLKVQNLLLRSKLTCLLWPFTFLFLFLSLKEAWNSGCVDLTGRPAQKRQHMATRLHFVSTWGHDCDPQAWGVSTSSTEPSLQLQVLLGQGLPTVEALSVRPVNLLIM